MESVETSLTLGGLPAALGAHYVLERELGRGGMATVYLARDLRHGRAVAIKVLHQQVSSVLGAERFLREIQLTASLQHPHILPLFDSGIVGGLLFYVMPFIEGETLRQRLERERQFPVDDAVHLACEVADALAHAHARGVVHRDVKPENILLQGGHALVADFGIALAVEQAGGTRLTRTGLSLGTPQYMAPEQAAGERTVDARADVYALGAVLYEMLAGEPPFTGSTAQALLARAMTETPRSLVAQRPSVPPHVDAAVRTALEKLPADRFATADAFRAALAAPLVGVAPPRTDEHGAAPRRFALPGALVAGVLAAGMALGWVLRPTSAAMPEPVRFAIEPDSGTLRPTTPAISPDGRTIVYAAAGPSGTRLYARRVDELTSRPLAHTEHGEAPFFSPNGEWVGFYASGALQKVRLDGGPSFLVSHVPSPAMFHDAVWAPSDTILYVAGSGILHRVPAAGGAAMRVTFRGAPTVIYSARPLPGGRAVLVTQWLQSSHQMGVLDLESGRIRQLGRGISPHYVAGYLVYASAAGALFRRPFDATRMAPTGSAEQIATDVHLGGDFGLVASLDVSASGAVVYRVGLGANAAIGRMTLTDRAGRELHAFAASATWTPRFSPDGRRVAYGARAPGHELSDVWITDLAAGTTERLTTDGKDRDNNDPDWSPDGKLLVYSAMAAGTDKDVIVQSLDGGAARRLTMRAGEEWPSDWSPDGRFVLFTHLTPQGDLDVWIQPADGGPARPYLATAAYEFGARVSPDGGWVAYTSNETGRSEVYLQSFPTPGRKTLASSGGGAHPIWRVDGRELFYWQDGQLIAATVAPDAPGAPLVVRGHTPLFRAAYVRGAHPNYDVSRDGTRIILVTGRVRANRLVVGLNVLNEGRVGRADRR